MMRLRVANFAVSRALSMAALMLAAPAGSALAQQADRPSVSVGDQWHFVQYWGTPSVETNRTWIIRSVTSKVIEGTENGEPLTLTPGLGVLESPRTKDSNPRSLDFPLEVGKQWRYTTDWVFKAKASKGSADIAVTVVAHEKLRVPAGEFDAFKLVAKGGIRGVSGINSQIEAETETTYWYAPAARAVVKSVNRNPYLGISTVELVAMRLQP
jgi:hypothetical protein